MAQSSYLLLFGCALNLFYVPSLIANPIIGGTPDTDHVFKHLVSIHALGSGANTFKYICSGSIISERHILTAANCFMIKVDDVIKEAYSPMCLATKIITGTNKINGPSGIERTINQVFIPKEYDAGTRKFADIAVALLSSDLGITHNSHRMKILPTDGPFDRDYYADKEALFSGFGLHQLQRSKNGEMRPVFGFSSINQFLNVQMLPSSICPNYASQICAKSSDELPIRVSCLGDSGAGLVFEDQLIGVLSSGPPDCNTNKYPMYFTRISFFQNFIDQVMNNNANHRDMHILGECNDRFIPTPGLQEQKNKGVAGSSSFQRKRHY